MIQGLFQFISIFPALKDELLSSKPNLLDGILIYLLIIVSLVVFLVLYYVPNCFKSRLV